MRSPLVSGSLVVMGILLGHAGALGFTSSVSVTATRAPGPPPTTMFQPEVCLCMNAAEIAAYTASGSGPVVVNIGGVCGITENDPIDDDELEDYGCFLPSGSWPVPPAFLTPCPPPVCFPFGPAIGPVLDSNYGSESPGDFQLGASGSDEGTVPPGTSVSVPGVGTDPSPTMPNRSS